MTRPLLEWSDNYLIGVDELDFEHKDLFHRLNELHGELAGHKDWAGIEHCLGEIYARVLAHFALEEAFMRDRSDPNYVPHKEEHDQFLEVIVEIIEAFRANPEREYCDALEVELQNWIINHITTSDQVLGPPQGSNAGRGEA